MNHCCIAGSAVTGWDRDSATGIEIRCASRHCRAAGRCLKWLEPGRTGRRLPATPNPWVWGDNVRWHSQNFWRNVTIILPNGVQLCLPAIGKECCRMLQSTLREARWLVAHGGEHLLMCHNVEMRHRNSPSPRGRREASSLLRSPSMTCNGALQRFSLHYHDTARIDRGHRSLNCVELSNPR